MSGSTKLALTAGLFAVLVALVAVTDATRSVAPLFGAWVPGLAVAWVLARPGPQVEAAPDATGSGPGDDVSD